MKGSVTATTNEYQIIAEDIFEALVLCNDKKFGVDVVSEG